MFKLTGAVVLVSIVSLHQSRSSVCAGVADRCPACSCEWLGAVRACAHEAGAEILITIRAEHRKIQGLIKPTAGSFRTDVNHFLVMLAAAAVVNEIVLLIWSPAVASGALVLFDTVSKGG